ncbi:hypothetical protein LLOABG_LLOABG_02365, partial [Dysosmobacter welbionis]
GAPHAPGRPLHLRHGHGGGGTAAGVPLQRMPQHAGGCGPLPAADRGVLRLRHHLCGLPQRPHCRPEGQPPHHRLRSERQLHRLRR